MKTISWSVIFLFSINFGKGHGILCYLCHQTTKECNNGVVNSIYQKNCTEGRCAVRKYETLMPGRKVLATVRDCASNKTKQEFVQSVSSDNGNSAKVIIFQECSTPLCNGANIKFFCYNTFTIFIVSLSLILFK